MLEVQNSTQENFMTYEKNLSVANEQITFEPGELKFFVAEIKEMIDNKEIIDLPKAVHNAKYFAMIERRIAEMEAGHWTAHELIEVD